MNRSQTTTPSPEGGRAFRQQVIEAGRNWCEFTHHHSSEKATLNAARFALQQAREQIAGLQDLVTFVRLPGRDHFDALPDGAIEDVLVEVDALLTQLESPSVPVREQQEMDGLHYPFAAHENCRECDREKATYLPRREVREQQEQIEKEDLGGHESHGGRGDLGPAARPERPHDEEQCPTCGQEAWMPGACSSCDFTDGMRAKVRQQANDAASTTARRLSGCFDAAEWAKGFMEIDREYGIHVDESTMLGWFANAIMAGYDHAKRQQPDRAGTEPPRVGWRRWAWVDSDGRLSIMKPNATREEVAELGEPDERLIRVQITEVVCAQMPSTEHSAEQVSAAHKNQESSS